MCAFCAAGEDMENGRHMEARAFMAQLRAKNP
jgi:hypothetical protein